MDIPEDKILDLTHHASEGLGVGYDIPVDLQALDVTGNRLRELNAALAPLTQLRRLCFRQNEVPRLDHLSTLTALEALDAYDNKIESLEGVQHCVSLTSLDVSFNGVREISHVETLTSLRELYLCNNKITVISAALLPLVNLRLLELGANRIREIEGLSSLVNLEELWLGKNKITELKGLEALTKLKKLSVQSNRLTALNGETLRHLSMLEELYVSHNSLTSMEGVQDLTSLRVLDVASNKISKIEFVQRLTQLTEFWCNDNQIASLAEIEKLRIARGIECIYLERNPVAQQANFRFVVAQMLPSLKQIDATVLRRT
eukprot:TRINITY_DN2211_c0_g1_i1.p1 TRINITY_DN2211_c0_g1~~TRINITY_DN2211_c0_g1_i1.p1  ORF type:complete len:317 (+),score=96.75 TRINITY_DN2211_c0_g1_i1:118-1068(+)